MGIAMEKHRKYKGVTIERLDEPHYKPGYYFVEYWWKIDVEVSVNVGGKVKTEKIPEYFRTLQDAKDWISDYAMKRITDIDLY